MVVYLARWVLPVSSRPIADGAVAVSDGSVAAVGPRKNVLAEIEDAETVELGDVVVLPGLVNAHTHLELSWLAEERPPGGDFLGWVREFLAKRDGEDDGVARKAAAEAVSALPARGTVAVGDVGNREWMPGLLGGSPLWAVAFHELHAFRTADAERLLDEAAARLDRMEEEAKPSGGRVRLALTPHAPHTTSAPLLKALAGRAAATGSPLSIHVAESDVEIEFLRSGHPGFRDLLKERDAWDDGWKPPQQSPVDYLDRHHVLSQRTLAVHCVHVGQQDVQRLQARGVTVVTCPRSNRYLGVGKAQVPKLLGAGIPVALGTDSLASAPDLDLFAEIAALLEDHPELSPAAALRMATLNGARALGLASWLGTIEKGKTAALLAVPLADPGDDPLATVASVPETVWRIEEAPVYEGREPEEEEEEEEEEDGEATD